MMTGAPAFAERPRGVTSSRAVQFFTTTFLHDELEQRPSSTRAHSTPPPSAWARVSSLTDGEAHVRANCILTRP